MHIGGVAKKEDEIERGQCWIAKTEVAFAIGYSDICMSPVGSRLLVYELENCHQIGAYAIAKCCLIGEQAITGEEEDHMQTNHCLILGQIANSLKYYHFRRISFKRHVLLDASDPHNLMLLKPRRKGNLHRYRHNEQHDLQNLACHPSFLRLRVTSLISWYLVQHIPTIYRLLDLRLISAQRHHQIHSLFIVYGLLCLLGPARIRRPFLNLPLLSKRPVIYLLRLLRHFLIYFKNDNN